MIINHKKEKAFNAITYFLEHTSLCNKKKMYKLLYILDFEHFKETGRSVTNYEYYAWKMGPVPKELHNAIDSNEQEFNDHFIVEKKIEKGGFETISFKSKKAFEEKYFTRREIALLKDISERFMLDTGNEMEEYTHKEGMPWFKVWVEEDKQHAEIPYEYELIKLNETQKQTILHIAEERKVFLENYK